MTDNEKTLTTSEFSKLTGISVSTIGKMLRQKKLAGEKRKGKWIIFESELSKLAVVTKKDPRQSSPSPPASVNTPTAAAKTYDVDTFVQMTYLTEKGVRQWVKSGRLSCHVDHHGKVLIDAANLDRRELKHLVRK